MVWGCMSTQGVGNLHFYLNILKTYFATSAEKFGIKDNYVFT